MPDKCKIPVSWPIAPMGDYGATNHPMRPLRIRMVRGNVCALPAGGLLTLAACERLRLAGKWWCRPTSRV